MNMPNPPTGDRAAQGWDARPATELIDHILTTYHEPLRRDVPPLIEAARKVERVHRGHPATPLGLADALDELWSELLQHMMKEERVLFPMLRAGARGPQVYMPVRMMEHEHDEHRMHLAKIRELTGDLEIPPTACGTWSTLYRNLRALEAELTEHIHLENNVLFPRAAGMTPG